MNEMSEKELIEFNKRIKEQSINLESEFNKYRIYGNCKDFTKFKIEHNLKKQPKVLCSIHTIVCEFCVLDYIKAFKRYRTENNLPESNTIIELYDLETLMGNKAEYLEKC